MTHAPPQLKPAEKRPGDEPIPGYRLLARLGKGGFGEVWKCEAPGGLPKAVKFVPAGGDQSRQELAAVEQIRTIRHPFLLTLERVELAGGELVMVMELADGQLQDRFRRCRADGLPGVPRDELLGYLREAAEALDLIGTRFGLQHLDVKPENLFLVAGHLKVGDYGLLRRTREADEADDDTTRGFTPRYTPPEILRGQVDHRSDQYSLALVYAELVSGAFPYPGRTAQQLMVQHVVSRPDLSALPPGDRPAVARALAKEPADRYPSCTAFLRALAGATDAPPSGERPLSVERPLPPGLLPGRSADAAPDQSGSPTLPNRGLVSAAIPVPAPRPTDPPAGSRHTPRPASWEGMHPRRPGRPRPEETPKPASPFDGLLTVMWVDRFSPAARGLAAPPTASPAEYAAAVLRAAAGERDPAADGEAADDQTDCRFLCTLPAGMVPLKLGLVAERWGMTVRQPDPGRIVLRRVVPPEPRKPGRPDPRPGPPAAFEVTVRRPAPPSAEYTAAGGFVGSPPAGFTTQALADLPLVLAELRGALQNLDERRAHPRCAVSRPVRVYPLYQDGEVGPPVDGRCVDLSAGGVCFRTAEPVRTARLYVEFPGVEGVAGQAVYVRVIRTWPEPDGHATTTCGRFSAGG